MGQAGGLLLAIQGQKPLHKEALEIKSNTLELEIPNWVSSINCLINWCMIYNTAILFLFYRILSFQNVKLKSPFMLCESNKICT